ncbi:MAG: Lrp/AsnC family transcriptional regulator [Candidatus Diapherotrites archaeon]|nr:Lrp/AsnC family transcriptional regulator [Candidatus Diapherotrites archaeon]
MIKMDTVEIDHIDRKIIEHLLLDGRVSFSSIAKQMNITDVAIKKRFERLVKKGIVKSIKAELDLRMLGYENPMYVQIKYDLSKKKDIIKQLSSMDIVVEICETIGKYNLLVKIVLPKLEDATKAIEKIGSIDGIIEIESMVVINEIKCFNSLPTMPLQKKIK